MRDIKNILTNTNSKIKKTAKLNNIRLYEFNLPAIDSCPFAKDCLSYCYANKGTYLYKNVQDKYQANYKLTKDSKTFINQVQSEIDSKKVEAIRIHSSGDFYNLKYLKSWVKIAKNNPNIIFYGYTKSVPLFRHIEAPSNFVFCFSQGGKKDHLIKDTDRKAVIFTSQEERKKAGYVDCTINDLLMTTTHKIGLVYH
jgi:hypothetical protein